MRNGGKQVKRIVWDWNGTLFDDLELSYSCINRLLEKQQLPIIQSIHAYRNVFGFPVKEYYQRVGFDFSKIPFEVLAYDYMADYQEKSLSCSLVDGCLETLSRAKALGISQTLLSASKKDYLKAQLQDKEIESYLDSIWGIGDIYATSKVDLAKAFVKTCDADDEIWFIGDSLHDHQVAKSVNCSCVLVSWGHQSKSRLLQAGVPVVDSLEESLRIVYEGT